MKAILFHPTPLPGSSAPEALPGLANLELADVPVPDLPGDDWVVVKSVIAGICGSDLGFLQGKPMPAAEPYFALPVIPGHELFGVVEAVGKRARAVRPGQRVAIDPSLGCRERALRPLCAPCRAGNPGVCEHLAEGRLKPGLLIGTCRDTGGGWGEYFVAASHRLHPLPDAIGDAEASLIEPFAVSLRAVLAHPPRRRERVVVIGAGTIGLMTIAALKAVEPSCRIACVAKYPFQAKLARQLGAEWAIDARHDDVLEQVGAIAETRVHRLSAGGALLAGGVRVVFDTITSGPTLNQALRMTRSGGAVVVLGLAAMPEGVDWTPVWLKEINVVGSLTYGTDSLRGRRAETFARAVELLRKRRADLRAVRPRTHPLERFREALIEAASKATSGAIKVSFAL